MFDPQALTLQPFPTVQLLAGQGDWERALAVLRAMALASVRPDSTTAGLLVAACVQGGNQKLASQLAAVSGGQKWMGWSAAERAAELCRLGGAPGTHGSPCAPLAAAGKCAVMHAVFILPQ